MNLEQDMREAYEKLKKQDPQFPYRRCRFAVCEMYERGYPIVAGVISLDNYCNIGIKKIMGHWWNYDPETGNFFDITAGQFNHDLNTPLVTDSDKFKVWKPEDNQSIYTEKTRGLRPDQVL